MNSKCRWLMMMMVVVLLSFGDDDGRKITVRLQLSTKGYFTLSFNISRF